MVYECEGCGTEAENPMLGGTQFWKDCETCGKETCWEKVVSGPAYYCEGCGEIQGSLKGGADEVTGTCSDCGVETFVRRGSRERTD